MSDITCDDCGTINEDRLDECELCGASLHAEKERREERIQKMLAPLAWGGFALFVGIGLFFMLMQGQTRMENVGEAHRPTGLDYYSVLHRYGEYIFWVAALGGVGVAGYSMVRHYFGDD